MLLRKLENLSFSTTDLAAKKEFYRQAIKYTLNTTDSKTLNEAARKVGVFAEIKKLKHSFLKGHPYALSKFWKATVVATGANNCNNCVNFSVCSNYGFVNPKKCLEFRADYRAIAEKYDVAHEDIQLVKSCLTLIWFW